MAKHEPDAIRKGVQTHLEQARRGFVIGREMSDEDLEHAMIEEIDRVLEHPAREAMPKGTELLREGQTIERIWILLDGAVRLERNIEYQDVVFHSRTVGPVIGLLGLALGTDTFFACRAETDISVIPLTLQQLDSALNQSPILSAYFVTVLLRSLARRHRRAVELHIEINGLNRTLSAERDQLADAMTQLELTQTLLVDSEKMATLGELAAGVAHDLNNPVAAISRAADHVSEDMDQIATMHPHGEILTSIMHGAINRSPLSTKKEREYRRALSEAIEDRDLAQRLVKVGLVDKARYEEYFSPIAENEREARLQEIECYYQLGSSIRNIRTCSERIIALVKSLKSYARVRKEMVSDVDVHEGLEESLLLFGHALHGVEVVRTYGELPTIRCSVSEINQVWMNFISNALDVLEGKGRLEIRTDTPDKKHVRVSVCDNGPGIPEDHLQRIFEMNFTTKHGRVDFGVGLGLTICQQIVSRHGGTISVESKPGDTCFSVTLPCDPPRYAAEETEP